MSSSLQPNPQKLVATLHSQLTAGAIALSPPPSLWKSGVYSIIDCVFSAQTKYETIVLPMLRERLAARPGMADDSSLRFRDLIADIDSVPLGRAPDRWDAYGKEVLNLQVLAGRRKVEVCYEIAGFFMVRNLETMADLQGTGEAELLDLVLGPLRKEIKGIGPALARYLAILLGVQSEIRPDATLLRSFHSLSDWCPELSSKEDMAVVRAVIDHVASEMNTTAARLENALWRHASQM